MPTADRLSDTFFALSDPTRRAILARLAEGPRTVKELAEPFAMSKPAISKHLRVLERAGLVTRGREAQWRPCALDAAPLREAAEWTGGFRRFWEASHDRLDSYLATLAPPTARPRAAVAAPAPTPAPPPSAGAATSIPDPFTEGEAQSDGYSG